MVSRCGSNVVSVQHDGSDPNMPISSCFLKLTLETRDADQIEQIRTELTKAVSSWSPSGCKLHRFARVKAFPRTGEGGCERSEQPDEGAGKQQLTGNYPLIRLYPKKKANLF